MELSALLIFAAALAVATGSPGPSVAALVARVIARGWRDVLPFLAAMWIGEALWLSCAIFGLSVIAQTFHAGFTIVKYAGVAYLLYLAWKMWTTPTADSSQELPHAGSRARLFFAGLAVTLGNPKIMIFYLALLPTIIDLAAVTLWGWMQLTLVMIAVLVVIDCSWMTAAAQARRMLKSPRAMRIANRVSASMMAGAAAAIAAR